MRELHVGVPVEGVVIASLRKVAQPREPCVRVVVSRLVALILGQRQPMTSRRIPYSPSSGCIMALVYGLWLFELVDLLSTYSVHHLLQAYIPRIIMIE